MPKHPAERDDCLCLHSAEQHELDYQAACTVEGCTCLMFEPAPDVSPGPKLETERILGLLSELNLSPDTTELDNALDLVQEIDAGWAKWEQSVLDENDRGELGDYTQFRPDQ